ncbi:S8 family peptidase [Actinomadura barringtoniae]|uniref:S8 family peptidase n=1 Tax=Actinomadura barringtoniae TaxID=1427535 RepID=A0A939TB37_9ACTN|nr:S8 family peptidase [Actinomadura barringtoniae]MBO2453142.1 S8 family peptidase [Actinomadura barringtoniae]
MRRTGWVKVAFGTWLALAALSTTWMAGPAEAAGPDPTAAGRIGSGFRTGHASKPSAAPAAKVGAHGAAAPHVKPALPARKSGFLPVKAARTVPGRYIVKLKRSDSPARTNSLARTNVRGTATGLATRFGGRLGHVYDTAFGGFSAGMSEQQARRLAADPAVEYVRPVRYGRLDGSESTQRDPQNWGLDRIDQTSLPLSSSYTRDDSRGDDWHMYVIDTGVDGYHDDFTFGSGDDDSRVNRFGFNSTTDDPIESGLADDEDGHGTLVAGIAAGTYSGVNKKVQVTGVKVLNDQPATEEQIIEGITWVAQDSRRYPHSVANMSMSFPADPQGQDPIDDAVTDAVAKGVTFVVSAGNDNDDACKLTPARNPAVITVSATTRTDARLADANYGKCVDLFAPGDRISGPVARVKATNGASNEYRTGTGTSFAAPLVTGAVPFLDIPDGQVTPGKVRSVLLANATKGAVGNAGEDSPNNLLYMGRATRPRMCTAGARKLVTPPVKYLVQTRKFAEYAHSNDGWTGGDGTYALDHVTGHSKLWIFSDTFLPPAYPDETRPRTAPFINNSIVEEGGLNGFVTHHGGTAGAPNAIVPADANGDWYWAGAPNRRWTSPTSNYLQIVYQRYHRFGTGLWDWGWSGNTVATFSDDLSHPDSVTDIPSGEGIAWGTAILDYFQSGDGYLYVYGVEDHHTGDPGDPEAVYKYLHIARVRGSDLRGKDWEYLDASGDWMTAERFSARQYDTDTGGHIPVSNEFSLTNTGTGLELVTQDTSQAFSGEIKLYTPCSPSGPFSGKTDIYKTTEGGPWGDYGNGNLFTYNAKVVAVQDNSDNTTTLTIAYNLNSLEPDDVYRNITWYQPRFIQATIKK